MEFLKQAEDYVKDLEMKIAQLEKENAAKDQEIKRLMAGGKPAPKTEESTPAAGAAVATAPGGGRYTRISVPKYKEPTQQEKDALTVYEDDPALGQKAPGLQDIDFCNGGPVEIGKGKPVVITFFSKLNKGDFGALSLLSEIQEEFKDQVDFCAIGRDGEKDDVFKFPGKYHGKYFDELQSPDGKPGLTVYMNFPLGFDESGNFNTQLKKVMKKGTVGVGLTVLIDGEGTIVWYEQFVRGLNVMGQLQTQIRLLLEGKPLLSNGPAPEEQVQEEAVDVPDDVDPFAKTGDY